MGLSLFMQQREFLAPNLDSSTRSHVTGSLFADEDVDVGCFHAPLFSALDQTHHADLYIHRSMTLMSDCSFSQIVYLQRWLVLARAEKGWLMTS